MPYRRRATRPGLALALLAALGAGAAAALSTGPAAADTAQFDISIAGIRAGELTLSTSQSGSTYEAGSRIRSTGLLGAVARLRFDGEATGRIAADGKLEPARYAARSRSTRSERDTEILFENGQPTRVRVAPPRSTAPDPAAAAGTIDPVSAGFALLRDGPADAICNARVDLFDGSRRSRLEIGRAQAQSGGYVCNGLYSRLEGEAHSVSDQAEWPFRLVYSANGQGHAQLQRIETRTRFGTVVVERRG